VACARNESQSIEPGASRGARLAGGWEQDTEGDDRRQKIAKSGEGESHLPDIGYHRQPTETQIILAIE